MNIIPREMRAELCRRLQLIVAEYGQAALKDAVIVGMYDADHVSDIPYLTCPTMAEHRLGRVDYKVARFFETM